MCAAFRNFVKSSQRLASKRVPHRNNRPDQQLLFESLEPRQLLAGDLNSAINFGANFGNGNDVGSDAVVDATGNVYITGSFQGTADFDPGTTVDA